MTSSLHDELRKAIKASGRTAFHQGATLQDNPHIWNQEALQDWRDGWLDAQDEQELSRKKA